MRRTAPTFVGSPAETAQRRAGLSQDGQRIVFRGRGLDPGRELDDYRAQTHVRTPAIRPLPFDCICEANADSEAATVDGRSVSHQSYVRRNVPAGTDIGAARDRRRRAVWSRPNRSLEVPA